MPETADTCACVDLSVVLPAFNEEAAVRQVIEEVRQSLRDWPGVWEIVVVDDASQDKTAYLAAASGVRVVRRTKTGGSGAARKTGLREARGSLVAMLDTDGSYPASALPDLLSFFPAYDQVNGARTTEQGEYKLLRIPAKWLIRKLAEWICAERIPDLNTGMKVFKRGMMLRYIWAIPDGFSCVSSMTIAFLCNGHPVHFVPIKYRPRVGRSKFRALRDGANYLMTVIRVTMYFRPLRVFLPASSAIGIVAILKSTFDVATSPAGILDSDILLWVTAVLLLAIGLLADVIVAQRQIE